MAAIRTVQHPPVTTARIEVVTVTPMLSAPSLELITGASGRRIREHYDFRHIPALVCELPKVPFESNYQKAVIGRCRGSRNSEWIE